VKRKSIALVHKKPGIRFECPVFLTALFYQCNYFFAGAAGAGAGAGAFSGAFSGAGAGAAAGAGAGAGFFSSCFAQPTNEKETASKRASTSANAFFISCFTSFLLFTLAGSCSQGSVYT